MQKLMLVFLLFAMAFTFVSCKKEEQKAAAVPEKYLYVSSIAGLVIYDKPDTKGTKLGLVPHGEKVNIIEEQGDIIFIKDSYGKWTKVKWNTVTGWGFSGEMCSFNILTVKDFAAKSISSDYKNYIEERKDALISLSPEQRKEIDKIISRVTNYTPDNISVVTAKENYVLIEYKGPCISEMCYINEWSPDDLKFVMKALYVWNDGWEKVTNFNGRADPYFFYLNDDRYPDIVTEHPEEGIMIYLGLPDEEAAKKTGLDRFEVVERDGLLPGRVTTTGRCGRMSVKLGDETMYTFDCKKNDLVEVKSGQ